MTTIYVLYRLTTKKPKKDIINITSYEGDFIYNNIPPNLSEYLKTKIRLELGVDFDDITWLKSSIEKKQCYDYLDLTFGTNVTDLQDNTTQKKLLGKTKKVSVKSNN